MSHHNNTPERVLSAPVQTFDPIVTHAGAVRSERRHGIWTSGKPSNLGLYWSTPNVPHVRTEPRRGRKVRRGRASS